jgi:GNAT superfamily N-acetyltransferase
LIIRPFIYADIDEFMDVAEAFFRESRNRDYTVDLKRYRHLILASVGVPSVSILVAVEDGIVAGYAILNLMMDFTQEPIGDMYQFYVRPEYRGSGVARGLRDAVVKRFDEWGCPLSHISADAGIDEDGSATLLFRNLWAKAGYSVTGVTMTRKK